MKSKAHYEQGLMMTDITHEMLGHRNGNKVLDSMFAKILVVSPISRFGSTFSTQDMQVSPGYFDSSY